MGSGDELEHRLRGDVAPIVLGGNGREARKFDQRVRGVYRRTVEGMLEVDGGAAITRRAMDRLGQVDEYVELLAPRSERLAMMLLDYEKAMHRGNLREIERFYDPYGL